jgi:hypothetical protein
MERIELGSYLLMSAPDTKAQLRLGKNDYHTLIE